ncbi:DUF4269 domain-containing protein [Sinomicrobium kalidii]|uniref:DUF4269 domain-containing protein n=1 Tax=Sinomicrobium kalidii TaxID=2900738 RepID=UPI001E55CB3E|nr:DUF4269 domain-containing protein [Sinomicrobium kalidii]UGU16371.1 DUF4269 domain-containing protein [Sinomicrobium kalidii]
MIDFEDITYLKAGSEVQQNAYRTLTGHGILTALKKYTPVLAGTIPIDIAVEDSDLDIICCWEDKPAFIRSLQWHFGTFSGFVTRNRVISGTDTVLAGFRADGFEVEIFGQNVPVWEQSACLHMIAEHALLCEKGEAFRQEVLKLKRKGCKTEPAFGMLLEIKGNPYTELQTYGRNELIRYNRHTNKSIENGI